MTDAAMTRLGTGTRRRTRAAVSVALLTWGLSLAVGLPAAGSAPVAASVAACTGNEGVTVVVDFGTLGGGVQVRCVTSAVGSGFDALTKAGFTHVGTQRFPGLLCRIDGKPSDDPCVNAPPPDRYWAYWTASAPGGTWTYSSQGAGNRTPPAGSVEGWAFSEGCDRTPGSGPCPSSTTTTRVPSTTTTGSPSTHTGAAGGAGAGDAPPTSGGPTSAPPAEMDADSSTTTAEDDPNGGSSLGDRAPQAGEAGDGEAAASRAGPPAGPGGDRGGGSPVGALVGTAAVLALGTLGVATARRRGNTGAVGE